MHPDLLALSRPVLASTVVVTINMLGFRMPAGFPSPADDHMVQRCDLIDLLSTHPQATYFMRVRGDSMIGAGIQDNDIVAVNRALEAHHNSLVVAVVDNEFTCKRFSSVTAKCAWWQPIRRIQTFVQRTARPWKSGAWLLQH